MPVDKTGQSLEPDAESKQLLERIYRRTTWALIAAVVAIVLSTISIVTVAAIFVLSAGSD
jgi:hypothetical protein